MSEVAWWQGDHGDEYTERNAGLDIDSRKTLWREILNCLMSQPMSVLEIGAGNGRNLHALRRLGLNYISGVEPNFLALGALRMAGFDAHIGTADSPGRKADLVFTSGVLIHIPPDELMAVCQGIYDAAERYIVCIEYFSAEPEEKLYRGRKLWKRDFGDYWMDNFDLKPLGCGFAWKRTTGLDNLTWWAFERCN